MAWPTADAINQRIEMSNAQNGRRSPLTGTGALFLRFGQQYGVHPGVVVAIMQRECQLGADGTILITWNNFAGLTSGNGAYPGTCGSRWGPHDRQWQVYCTVEQGIEGVFKFLRKPIYTATGGNLSAIMEKYSPRSENDWPAMWNTFSAVGLQLGTPIGLDTNVYGDASGTPGVPLVTTLPQTGVGSGLPSISGWLAGELGGDAIAWLDGVLPNAFARVALVSVGLLALFLGLKAVV